MLLRPELDQSIRQPASQRQQPVNAGVAGCAKHDEARGIMQTRLPVMHMQASGSLPCPAGTAAAAVSLQNGLAVSIEAGSGIGSGAVAPEAEPGDGRAGLPAVTE